MPSQANRKTYPAIVEENEMLWTITIILFILWVVGLVSSYTLGGWIHILLVLAIIVLIFNLMSGRRALRRGSLFVKALPNQLRSTVYEHRKSSRQIRSGGRQDQTERRRSRRQSETGQRRRSRADQRRRQRDLGQ